MNDQQELKDCPFCGEKINIKAIKCKHCLSMLNEAPTSFAPQVAGVHLPMPGAGQSPSAIDKGKALEELIASYHAKYREAHPKKQMEAQKGIMGFLKSQVVGDDDPFEVFVGDEITPELLGKHSKYTTDLNPAVEKPLLVVNEPAGLCPTGIVLTNRNLYCATVSGYAPLSSISFSLKEGLAGKSQNAKTGVAEIASLGLGESNIKSAYKSVFSVFSTVAGPMRETTYVGHLLLINGKEIGFLRMGGGLLGCKDVLSYLAELFGKATREVFSR